MNRKQSVELVFAYATVFELFLGVLAIGASLLVGTDPRTWIPSNIVSLATIQSLGVGILCSIPMLIVLAITKRLPDRFSKKLSDMSAEKLAPFFAQFHWTEILVLSIAAGVGEELLFRGWLQTLIAGEAWTIEPWSLRSILGLIFASVMFGAVHSMGIAYFVLATFFGLILGAMFMVTQNLLVPIVAHAIYDFVAIQILIRQTQSKTAQRSI